MSAGDAHVWIGRSRRGKEADAGTEGWAHLAACKGDPRYIDRSLDEDTVQEMIEKCHSCPVESRCLLWAEAQTQPVGFAVAGGKRWKAWNHCAICGKKVRGVDRCSKHADIGDPVGTIEADGTCHEYRVTDEH